MANHGIHHLGLATHDMEATLEFYENVLGFETRVCDVIQPEGGGTIRHAFLDAGNGELIAFMECNAIEGIAADFDTGINKGLGIGGGVMHFAFAAADENDLLEKQKALQAKGVQVSEVVDHGWCQSIYFRDPNRLHLEYCVLTEQLSTAHVADRSSDAWLELARSQD